MKSTTENTQMINAIETSPKITSFIESMTHKPSDYQVNVFKAVLQTLYNIVVNAVAGSGKTTTLMSILRLINDKKTLVIAFNKEIKEELGNKVSNLGLTAKVQTAHSFGYTTIMRNLGTKPTINPSKARQLFKLSVAFNKGDNKILEVFKGLTQEQLAVISTIVIPIDIDEDDTLRPLYYKNVNKLVDMLRMFNTNLDSSYEINDIIYKYSIAIVANEVEMAIKVIKLGLSYTACIDYCEMLYMPVAKNMKVEGYDFVMIDECQDINNSARILLLKARKYKEGRFIAVGDVNQAIYGFAGANSDSFEELQKQYNTITLPLSLCYRCGSDIIGLAQEIVPQIEAHESTGKGVVRQNASIKDIKANDMILCRNTAPLVKLCFDYIKNGVVAIIKGSDIAKGIVSVIKGTGKSNAMDVIETLEAELEKTLEAIMRVKDLSIEEAREESEYATMLDKVQVVKVLVENCNTATDMIAKVESMFSDDGVKNAIQLSSIHRSKGLEAKNVFIVERELMPSKWAKQDWEKQQEQNLIYVAYTRAMESLNFVTDWYYKADTADSLKKKAKIAVSDFVGAVGQKVSAEFTITDIQSVMGFDGQTSVYTLTDAYGNVWSKWSTIDEKFIISESKELAVGTQIKCQALIKGHTTFKGNKVNQIKTLSVYSPKTDISLLFARA